MNIDLGFVGKFEHELNVFIHQMLGRSITMAICMEKGLVLANLILDGRPGEAV